MKTFSSAKQKVLKFKYFIKVGLGPKLIPKARNVCLDGLCPCPPVCILQLGPTV